VVQVVGQVAKNNDRTLQEHLNRRFGVRLITDAGRQFSGPLAVNNKGSMLAYTNQSMRFSLDPEGIRLVSTAAENGWWREPDPDNAFVLIETLRNDKDPNWRSAAADSLCCAPTTAVVQELVTALQKDQEIRRTVAWTLVRIATPPAIQAVKAALEKDHNLASWCEENQDCRAAIKAAK
jgi:hypothetical protein